jgi:predicted AlkP superfamily phosphohydrolase/phosphomutase
MRAAVAALVMLSIAVSLWLLLAWVPADGALHAWQASEGAFAVPEKGVKILPRWSYRRGPSSALHIGVGAASQEGATVEVELSWDPAPGFYQLSAADDVESGLRDLVTGAVRNAVGKIELACFVPEMMDQASGLPQACPPDLELAVTGAVASVVDAEAERFDATFAPDSQALRDLILGSIADGFEPVRQKVLVLGLDGLDWDLVLPWVRSGKMPNLGRLLNAGSWGEMETLVPTLSPLIWTTVATGVAPDRHGILDFVEKEPRRGTLVPITGRNRKVPAVWNLASALGRSVGVVGWWATWPAEKVRGAMVTDRLYYTLTQGISEAVLRRDPPEMVFPGEIAKELVGLRDRAVKETDWQAVRQFMDVPEERFAQAVEENRGMEDPVDGFRRILAATRTYLGAGLLLAEEQPDLMMVYLEGTDTLGHLLAPYMPPPTLEIDATLAAKYVQAVPRYFQIVDRWIGRYLEHYPLSESAVIVVSDHGFKWREGRPTGLSGTSGPTAPLWHEPDAIFVAAGRGVERLGRVGSKASIYDVSPTVLALLGLPGGEGWQGRVLPGCDDPALEPIDYEPLVPPSSYRPELGAEAAPVDPEFVTKLRALGYLGGGEPSPVATSNASPVRSSAEDRGASRSAATDPEPTRGQLNNLAVVKINQKEYEEGERLLRQAIALSPEYPSPHYNLRRIYMETQRYEDADRELWIAVSKGLRDPERTIDRAAADYDDLDLQDRTVALLTIAIERFPDHEPFWVHLLVAMIRTEKCSDGRELGTRAASRFPGSAPVHAFYGLAAACVGDVSTAHAAITRSLEINPDQARLRRTLDQLPSG